MDRPVEEVSCIVAPVFLAFIAVIGPLSYFFGADSRRIDDRGWFAASRS
jgi:hypothetical protein